MFGKKVIFTSWMRQKNNQSETGQNNLFWDNLFSTCWPSDWLKTPGYPGKLIHSRAHSGDTNNSCHSLPLRISAAWDYMRKEGDCMYVMHIKIHARWQIYQVEGRLNVCQKGRFAHAQNQFTSTQLGEFSGELGQTYIQWAEKNLKFWRICLIFVLVAGHSELRGCGSLLISNTSVWDFGSGVMSGTRTLFFKNYIYGNFM